MPEQELDGPEIACAPIDQGGFCASQRMRPKQPRVQADASDPLRYEARILAGRHACGHAATPPEKKIPGPLVCGLQIITDGPAGVVSFISNRGPRPVFFLR